MKKCEKKTWRAFFYCVLWGSREDIAREAATRQNELADIISELNKFKEIIYTQHLSFDLRPETASSAQNDVQDGIQYKLIIMPYEEQLQKIETSISSFHHDISRLNVLASLLIEFSSKTSSLQSWMTHQTRVAGSIRERSADPQYLSEARREAKRLLEEVAREESSLKAIGALLSKIEQEVDSLYDSVPDADTRGIHSTEIRNTFYRVEDDFSALQKQCADLIQFQNRIGSLGTELSEHLRKVDDWFASIEGELTEVDRAPDMAVEQKLAALEDLNQQVVLTKVDDWFTSIEGELTKVDRAPDMAVEQKLAALEDLNQQVVDGHKHFDKVDQASRRLLNALDGLNAHPEVASRHETEATERKRRHERLLDRIQEVFNHANAQKAANEGVRDAVLDLHRWLDDYEQRAGISRDIPLVEESLNELKREVQLLRMDLDSRIAVSKDLAEDLSKLSASNPPEWKNMIEEKLKKAVLRLQKISTDLRSECGVPTTLDALHSLQTTLERLNKSRRAEQRRLDDVGDNCIFMEDLTMQETEATVPSAFYNPSIRLSTIYSLTFINITDIRLRGRELAGEASIQSEAQQVLDRSKVLSDEWDLLSDNIDAMRDRVSRAEKWVDGYTALEKWLAAKRRMLAAVGVVTTDSAIASTQLGQIQIIKAEMDGERSTWSKLNDVAQKLSSDSNDGVLSSAMNKKLEHLKDVALSSRNEGDEIEKKLESLLDLALNAKSEIDQVYISLYDNSSYGFVRQLKTMLLNISITKFLKAKE
ncbi:unnamed protein product [Strongylus vulgaris]|uniref:Uncharacterized protein n=1 Tax=Strongylus vulgaris TaxID=40348 RepID=A0A3P7J8P7_STRVU|nr:unnamed protein product [Strongylus vulgaris]